MKAVVSKDGAAVWSDAPSAAAGPDHAVVRPSVLGIGSPDLAAVAGRIAFTGVLGHEFIGVVESVNAAKETQKRWMGKRVVASPGVPCGRCSLCTRGLSTLCQDRSVLGLHARDGCFAERFVIPLANLVEIPKALPDQSAVFAGVVAGALHASRVVRFEHKTYVTVLGDGPAGLITAQVLTRLNASVRLLGTNPAKYTLCEKWGIRHRHVREVGKNRDQDIVVDCTNDPAGLELAMQLVRPRGTVIARSAPALVPLGALVGRNAGVDFSAAVCNELTIVGAGAGAVRDGVEALVRGDIEVASLVSRRFKFADAPAAFLHAARPDSVKVLVDGPA